MPNGKTLESVWQDNFHEVPTHYGEKWLFFHRQDIHDGLREMAQDPNLKSARAPPVCIRLGSEVTSVNPEAGTFTLGDGYTVRKDLIIVANGLHTKFQPAFINRSNPYVQTGKAVYHAIVPMQAVLDDELTAPLFQNQEPGLLGPNTRNYSTICGHTPVRNNTLLSLTYIHPIKPFEESKLDWRSPAALVDLEGSIADFNAAIKEIPRKVENTATDISCYNIVTRNEIPTFTKGRALLLGDAAHPMLTTHAQGSSMSIESCAALEQFFYEITNPADVPERLRLFNEFRHGRCVATQIMSNGGHGCLKDSVVVNRIRTYYNGPLPARDTEPWGKGFRDFFFGYDVFGEAASFLNQRVASRQMIKKEKTSGVLAALGFLVPGIVGNVFATVFRAIFGTKSKPRASVRDPEKA